MNNNQNYISHEVFIGAIPIGGNNPIRLQSMTNTNTLDTNATVEQCIRMIEAGCDYVRITTPTIKEAENLLNIKAELQNRGHVTPIIADVHFNSKVAEFAAGIVEKVRINPGNYCDKKVGAKITYTREEYNAEIERIKTRLTPLIEICKKNGTALRIGSNHGSLSDRIINKYGNTAEGMVEAAMEFLRICKELEFKNVVVSMKSSDPNIMINSTRMLVTSMEEEGMSFPIHLGVTEAGEGEDGKIKSSLGIGTLLQEGIGDTIRVSLTDAPEKELPVAKCLVDKYNHRSTHFTCSGFIKNNNVGPKKLGGISCPIVVSSDEKDTNADYYFVSHKSVIKNSESSFIVDIKNIDELSLDSDKILVIDITDIDIAKVRTQFTKLKNQEIDVPIILKKNYKASSEEEVMVYAASEIGSLILHGYGDGIWLEADMVSSDVLTQISFSVLQSTKKRITKTEFISCPSCGRTLFDINTVLHEVKDKTSHLTGLKIAVMGCIVNGPGEMGEADYGYIGAGNDVVNLYKGSTAIAKKIPAEGAVDKLIQLIKDNGDWVNPEK